MISYHIKSLIDNVLFSDLITFAKTATHPDATGSQFNAHWMLHPSKNFTGSAADAGQHAVEARLGAPLFRHMRL